MKTINKLFAVIIGLVLIGSLIFGLPGIPGARAEGETEVKNADAELKFGEETWVEIEGGHDYVENAQWFLHHPNYFSIDGALNFNGAPNPAGLNSRTVYDGDYILDFELYGTNAMSTLVFVVNGSASAPSFYDEPYFIFIQPGQICMPGQSDAKAEDFSAISNWAAGTGVKLRFAVLNKSITVYGANVTESGADKFVKLVVFENYVPFGEKAERTSGTIRLVGYDEPLNCKIDNLKVTSLADNDGTIRENFDNNSFDEDKWILTDGGKSPSFNAPDEKVKGLVVDDNALAFAGTVNNSRFESKVAKRNFVFSFDYITTAKENRPVLNPDSVTTDFSWCGIWFARSAAADAYTGKGVLLQDWQVSATFDSSKKNESMPDLYPNWGKTATYKVTLAVNGGEVLIYISEKSSDGTYGAASVVCEWTVSGDTYGYVGITSDNAGYWGIDNISYTDLPQTGELPALIAPRRVSVKERENGEPYLRWNPVEWATAYEVIVNEEPAVTVEKNEFEIKDLTAGTYNLKIVAKGDEKAFKQSKATEFVYEVVSVTLKGGDEVLDTIHLKKGNKITLENPEKEGYNFGGWYTDSAFGSVFDKETAIEENTVLYAKFVKSTEPEPSSESKESQSGSETKPEQSDKTSSGGASGGCFGGINSFACVSVSIIAAIGVMLILRRKIDD